MSNKRTLELLATVATRFGGKSVNLLVFVLTAHHLSLADMAVYGTVFSLTLIYSAVLDFGVRNSLAVFVGKEPARADAFTRQAFLLWLIFLPITLPVMYFSVDVSHASIGLINAVAPSTVLLAAMLYLRMMQGTLLGQGNIGLFNKTELASRIVLFAGTLVLLVFPGLFALVPALWVLAISQVFAAFYLFIFQRLSISRGSGQLAGVAWKMFSRGFVFMLSVLLMHVSKRASFLVVGHLTNSESAAVFFALQRLTEVMTEVGMAVSVVMFSQNVRTQDAGEAARMTAYSCRLTLLVLGGIAVFFAIFADWIVPLALGQQYAGNNSLFLVLLLGTLLSVTWVMLFPSMSVATSPMKVFYLMLPGSLLNVVLAWILAIKYGPMGAAWAMLVSSCITTGLFLITYKGKFGIPYSYFLIPSKSDFNGLLIRLRRK